MLCVCARACARVCVCVCLCVRVCVHLCACMHMPTPKCVHELTWTVLTINCNIGQPLKTCYPIAQELIHPS